MKRASEWWIVGALTLLAAGLRFWGFGRLGLTHFDEGVYAIAGFWSIMPAGLAGLDPQVIAYAPPGFPILVGLSYIVFGVADSSAIFVSIVCGILTVPVVAWLGRRTFGPGAGAASAAFAALAMAHIAFSRKALTEAPFLLCWIMAVGLGGRFLERPGFLRAVGFGLAVGLAQNFKYNGWITGAIVIVAALLGLLRPEARKPGAIVRTFGFGSIAVVVAAGCYLPWYLFVERHGGYAALVRHHQSYLGGVGSWGRYWEMQLGQAVALSGGRYWGGFTWAIAWVVASFATPSRLTWNGGSRWAVGLLTGALVLAFAPDLGWWVGVGMVVPLLGDARPACRVLGAWWLVMSVMTPLYHPYARLWMPLHAAGWILLAGVVRSGTVSMLSWPKLTLPARRSVLVNVAVALVLIAFAGGHWSEHRPFPLAVKSFFEPTDDLRKVVRDLRIPRSALYVPAARFSPENIKSLRVLGRRPLAFYLAVQGEIPFQLMSDQSELSPGPGRLDEYILVDEVHLDSSNHPPWNSLWGYYTLWSRLDPVTLLDIRPGVAFDSGESRFSLIELRARLRQPQPRPQF